VIGESSGVEPIAWTGSAIGAVWRSNEDLRDYFGTFDAVGAPITEPVLLPGATTECAVIAPSIEWTGSEFGVLYHKNSPPDLWFARLAPDGSMVDQLDVTDSDAPHTGYKPSLAWSGSVFGAAYVYIGPGSSPVMLDIIGWCN
jgi:hypothetical protein